jgi:hypothetical protein
MVAIESFVAWCVKSENVFWTYHINLRLKTRNITSEVVLYALMNGVVIEQYLEDLPLSSYLFLGRDKEGRPLHIVVAIDRKEKNIRIITAYRPSLEYWNTDLKTRRRKT